MKKSDISKWNSSLVRYKTKCEKISKVSKSVRYVGIINLHGRTLAGKINSGTKPLFSPSQVRKEFFAIATVIKLRKKSLSSIAVSYTHLRAHETREDRGWRGVR